MLHGPGRKPEVSPVPSWRLDSPKGLKQLPGKVAVPSLRVFSYKAVEIKVRTQRPSKVLKPLLSLEYQYDFISLSTDWEELGQ